MSLLQAFGTGQGYLKAGFLGFPKSGKSYTSALLALGLYDHLKLSGAVAMFDTEGGSEYLAPLFKKAGIKFAGIRSRSLGDLINLARECQSTETPILIADSMTHVWREVCDSYLKQVNESLRAKGRGMRTRLEFQDWGPIKAKWAEWTDLYLNSRLHVIICGRAGYEWDFEDREDGTGKDLVKTGIKMKTEGEFGFEPSLLVEMERVQSLDENKKLTKIFTHRATVLGDRFAILDGQCCDNPTYAFFKPHIDMLVPGAHAPIDTEKQTDLGIGEDGSDQYHREKRQRAILVEEIEGELMRAWPGQSKEEKSAKLNAIESAFGTRSWIKVEGMDKEKLTNGLAAIRALTTPATTDNTNGEAA
jgi:hypothetical protein